MKISIWVGREKKTERVVLRGLRGEYGQNILHEVLYKCLKDHSEITKETLTPSANQLTNSK